MTLEKPVPPSSPAPWALPSPPISCSAATGWGGALVRRWERTASVMVQPPLEHHYAVLHLGGVKKVERRCDGPTVSTIAENGSITLVPAGTAFTWRTTGPIAFAHLYLRPMQLDEFSNNSIGRDGGNLVERVAVRDRILEPLFRTMLTLIEGSPAPSVMHLDCLLETFLVRLARDYCPHAGSMSGKAVALAPHRLRRALDYIEANVGNDIRLSEVVRAAGSTQFHFSHAFRIATGIAPYHYLIARRIELAKMLLMTTGDSLDSISDQCGFNSSHQFGVMFKHEVGVGPKRYRKSRS